MDLSTIFIELFPPDEDRVQPPSAFLSTKLSDVSGRVAELRALAESFEGRIDRVVVSERNGIERAELTLVVFANDFRAVLASIESEGGIVVKETNQATDASPAPEVDSSYSNGLRSSVIATTALSTAAQRPLVQALQPNRRGGRPPSPARRTGSRILGWSV